MTRAAEGRSPEAFRAFIVEHTAIATSPLVPEVRLHLATEIVPIWQMTEAELEATGLPPPYWAFAWAGGQALARYVLDTSSLVAGRSVADFGAGSGLVAIAAMKAGAASAVALEIDPCARAAVRLNAAENSVEVGVSDAPLEGLVPAPDVVLAGDVFYERSLADHIRPIFDALAADGTEILVGDPGRAYVPKDRLKQLAEYRVQTSRELEDSDVRNTRVWSYRP